MTRDNSRSVEWIAKKLTEQEKRLSNLEIKPNLAYSSIDDGSLTVRDADGNVTAIIGKQEDGTYTSKSVDGPPPPKPSTPGVYASAGTIAVSWDGRYTNDAKTPMDFAHVEVHMSTEEDFEPQIQTLSGVISSPDGGSKVTSNEYGEWFVRLVAKSESGKVSEPSDTVAAVLVPLVAEPDIAGAIEEIYVKIQEDFSKAQTSADGKSAIWHSQDPPPNNPLNPHKESDTWFDPKNGNRINKWQPLPAPGAWVPVVLDDDALSQAVNDVISGAADTADRALLSANGKNRFIDSTNDKPANTTDHILGDTWRKWTNLGTSGKLMKSWTVKGTPAAWVEDSMDPTYLPKVDIGEGTFGSLMGDRIEAGTILVKTLAVTDFTNYIPNLNSQAADWTLSTGVTIASSSLSAEGKRFSFPATALAQAKTPKIGVTPGEKIKITLSTYLTTATNKLEICWFGFTGTGAGASSGVIYQHASTATSIPDQTWTVPSTVAQVEFSIRVPSAANTVSVGAYNFTARKMTGAILLEDGAIKAGSAIIDDLAVTDAKIGSLNGGKIVAGTIEGKHVKAQTLTAENIVVASTDNLINDPNFEFPSLWAGAGGGSGSGWSTDFLTGAAVNAYKLMPHKASQTTMSLYAPQPRQEIALPNGSKSWRYGFPVSPGDWYTAQSMVYSDGPLHSVATSVSQQIYFHDANGAMLAGSPGNQVGGAISRADWVPNQWNRVGGKPLKVPEGAARISVRLTVYLPTSAAPDPNLTNYYVALPQITRAMDGKLIVDGEILANHIKADAIEAKHIKANAIEADKIQAGAIRATHLAVGGGSEIVSNGSGEMGNNVGFESFTRITTGLPAGFLSGYASSAGQGTTNFQTGTNVLKVKPNTKYRVAVWVKANKIGSVAYLQPMTGGANTAPTYPVSARAVPTTWTLWDEEFKTNDTPGGTMYMRWFLNHSAGTATDSIFSFTGFSVQEMTTGALIVDGAIDGKTITGALIQTSDLSERGIKLNGTGSNNYLKAWDSAKRPTFSLDGNTGEIFVAGVLTNGTDGHIMSIGKPLTSSADEHSSIQFKNDGTNTGSRMRSSYAVQSGNGFPVQTLDILSTSNYGTNPTPITSQTASVSLKSMGVTSTTATVSATLRAVNADLVITSPATGTSDALMRAGSIELASSSGGITLTTPTSQNVYTSTLRLTSTGDASEGGTDSAGHALQIGTSSGIHVKMDNNELLALTGNQLSNFGVYGDSVNFSGNNNTGGEWIASLDWNGRSSRAGLKVSTAGATYAAGARAYFQVESMWTTTNAANCYVNTSGTLYRSTSSGASKLDTEDLSADKDDLILSLKARTWFDKRQSEELADYLEAEASGETPVNENLPYLRRIPGMVAEEVEAAGLTEFVQYGIDGQVEGLMYDRLGVALIPVVARQRDRIDALESSVQDLNTRLANLEARFPLEA